MAIHKITTFHGAEEAIVNVYRDAEWGGGIPSESARLGCGHGVPYPVQARRDGYRKIPSRA